MTDPESPAPATEQETAKDPGEEQTANKEAAGYRRRLRAAESELETARATLGRLQRQSIEQAVAGRLATPADFWLTTELPHLLDAEGNVDADAVEAKLADVLASRPGWAKQDAPNFDLGNRGPSGSDPPPSWGDVLRRKR